MSYSFHHPKYKLEGETLEKAIQKHFEYYRSGYGLAENWADQQFDYYKDDSDGKSFILEHYSDNIKEWKDEYGDRWEDKLDEWLWQFVWDDFNLFYDDVKDNEEDLSIMFGIDLDKTEWVCDNCGEVYLAKELSMKICECFCPNCFTLTHFASRPYENLVVCGNCGWEIDLDKICFEKKCDCCKDYLKVIVGECDKEKVYI